MDEIPLPNILHLIWNIPRILLWIGDWDGDKIKPYHNIVSRYEFEPMLCMCKYCGELYICDIVIRCPVCSSSNIKVAPIRDHPKFCIQWLVNHGFPYFRERKVVECIVE